MTGEKTCGRRYAVSKFNALWEYVRQSGSPSVKLTFAEIHAVIGMEIDHSFLNYKKELEQYGYRVWKISLKEQTVLFQRMELKS